MKLKPLAEQVILITGASSGIGLVTARKAAKAGAKVMLVSRNGEALAEIVRGIQADGGEADHAVADVGDRPALVAAAAACVARFGRIDTWVNDAGVAIYAKLLETPLDEHERLFRTNYFGAVNGVAAAVPHLREAGGALITVGSIVSDLPSPIMGAYSASKHAVKGFIQSLRIELAADKLPISVTLIKPAGVDTPVAEHAANHGPGEALLPPPVVDPERVAAAILDAAVHPRREVTVGIAGRAQVLLGTQFPALFEKLAPALMPLLFDPTRRKTPGSNLFRPGADGLERAEGPPTAPSALVERSGPLLPTAMLAGGAMALAAGLAAWRRRAPSPT